MNTTVMPEPELRDDTQLVSLCLAGDRDAFGQIVARYQSLVCALAYSACGDIARSEDLAQETFLAAWRQLRGLKEPTKLKSWLCGIVRNLINDLFPAASVFLGQRTDSQPPDDGLLAANVVGRLAGHAPRKTTEGMASSAKPGDPVISGLGCG